MLPLSPPPAARGGARKSDAIFLANTVSNSYKLFFDEATMFIYIMMLYIYGMVVAITLMYGEEYSYPSFYYGLNKILKTGKEKIK